MERLADNAVDRAHTRFIVSADPQEVADKIQPYIDLGLHRAGLPLPRQRPAALHRRVRHRRLPAAADMTFEVLDRRFEACFKTTRASSTTSTTAAAGPRARRTSPRTARWCGRTSRTTGCCATTSRPATSACSASPSGYTNGHTVDPQGRLVSCEHGNRRVTRTEHDGTITVLADSFEGKRLNTPNDVVVRSDGAVYFTDPTYGIESDYEGYKGASEIETAAAYVFRVDPITGALSDRRRRLRPPERARVQPRRAAARTSPTPARRSNMSVLDVADDGALTNRREFADVHQRRLRRLPARRGRPDLDERRRRRARL